MVHLDDILPELLLGTLDAPARLEAERHLASCAHCRAESERLAPAMRGLALSVAPVEPPPAVLARVVAGMEGPGRLARFADKVARLFDVGRDKALRLLESLSEPAAWQPGFMPGMDFVPVEAGAGREGMAAMLVRFAPGMEFPHHEHATGDEWTLVLEGGLREDSGAEAWPGELMVKAEGSAHALSTLPGPACVVALLSGPLPPGQTLSLD
jgi:putative transcriptional regulator